MKNNFPIYFILGTRAQFIKTAPVMHEMLKRGMPYTLIYTAQHRENIDEIPEIAHPPGPNVLCSKYWG
jgi:UDP-N-acetylglucosamine 2-epimerase